MLIIAVLLLIFGGAVLLLMIHPVFGAASSGNRLVRLRKSPNFRKGIFHNLSLTPVQTKEFSVRKLLHAQFNPPPDKEPGHNLPVKQEGLTQKQDNPVVVWYGHSSYSIHLEGKHILVDPVFSGHAAPVKGFGKSFPGTDLVKAHDFTTVDALIITHDHYDHLDYKTIRQLQPVVKHFYTSLGVGAHLERWGISNERITELDWWERVPMFTGVELIAAPARHFSGRSFKRYPTLWSSFILKTPVRTLYLGGDSGYDTHFKEIGDIYGPFDLAILECGQYNTMWPLIHLMPEETVQAALDLKAAVLLPVHWGKFSLALHPWKEPIRRLLEAAKDKPITVTTPLIGEQVVIGKTYPQHAWWEVVQ